MKKAKRWLALLLCGAMVLTGAACAGGGDTPSSQSGGTSGSNLGTGKGRYVESDITPPGAGGEPVKSFLTAEGSLVCYTLDLMKRFESADGGATWQESAGPAADGVLTGNVEEFDLMPDGGLLVALAKADGNGLESLVKVLPNGIVEPVSIPALDEAVASGQYTYISLMKVVSQNRLMLSFSSGDFGGMASNDAPAEPGDDSDSQPPDDSQPDGTDTPGPDDSAGGDDPDSTGDDSGLGNMFVAGEQTYFAGLIDMDTWGTVAEYPDWYGVAATADESTLYLLDYSGDVLAKSLADGSAQKAGEGSVPVSEFSFGLGLGAGKDGLYVLDNKRLQRLADGVAETVMDGATYSFSDPGSMAQGVHVLDGGEIVLNMMRQSAGHLYKYTWDENASLDPAKMLKVWSLNENTLVRNAISALRRSNPEMSVEYEVALSGEGGITAEDAIKNLNTRLLSGDGPDVMLLDGCPAESYATRGLLADLAKLVDTGGVFENLAAPFKTDQGTFYLPMSFKVPLLLGTGDTLDAAGTLEQLAELVRQGKGLPTVGENDDVFAGIAEGDRPVMAPQDLREIFDLLWNTGAGSVLAGGSLDSEALGEVLAALKTISDKYDLGSGGGAPGGAIAMMSSDGSSATATGSALAYASQRALLGGYLADDMQMRKYMMEPPGSEMAAFPGLDTNSFIPQSLAAVSADSEKTDLAAQFIQTMLSDEVQGIRTGGFPVTQSGMEKQISNLDEMMREYQDEGFEFDYAGLVALAQTPQLADDVVTDMVWAAAQKLCAGETDLEGAVKQLEQDLKNYLAERQ